MKLRKAALEDAEVLAKILIASWRQTYAGLVPDSYMSKFDITRRTHQFQKAIAERTEETYVAEAEKILLGFSTIGPCRDEDLDPQLTGEIWAIYLAPEYWRKGLGSQLCRYAEEQLRAKGYGQIALWVFKANQSARMFYSVIGYEPDGGLKILHFGLPLDVIRCIKNI